MDLQALIHLDRELTLCINQQHNAFLDVVVGGVAMLGNGGVLWVAVPIVFIIWGSKRERMVSAIFIAAVGLTHFGPFAILQGLWPRERPYEAMEGIRLLGTGWPTSSFPSGHAYLWVGAAIVYGALYRRYWMPLMIMAVITT